MGRPVEGIQGQGKATIWKDSPDFWRFATMQRQDQQIAAKAIQAEKEKRDKIIDENLKFAPGKVWEPFYGEVEDYIQSNVRQFSLDLLNKNVPPGAFEGERSRRMGEAKKLENKINHFRTKYDEAQDVIKQDAKYLNGQYYQSKLNDFFFNGRQAKPSDQVNVDGIENIFNDSKGYNMSAVASDFMKDLPQQLTEKYRKTSSDLGEQFDVSILKSKLGIVMDANGAPVLDPRTGNPLVQMTDDVAMAALDNPKIRNYVIDNLGADILKPGSDIEPLKDFLAPLLTPYDQRSAQKQLRNGFKYGDGDRQTPVVTKNVEERYDTLYKITHENNPELLSAIRPGLSENVDVAYEVYAPGESKSHTPRIVVTYPNKAWNKDVDGKKNRNIRKVLSLETEEDRQAAMEFLNTAMDERLDAKDRIGEKLTNYRKHKRQKEKDQGGVYEDADTSDTGGVY